MSHVTLRLATRLAHRRPAEGRPSWRAPSVSTPATSSETDVFRVEERYRLDMARIPVKQYEAFAGFAGQVDLLQTRDLVAIKPGALKNPAGRTDAEGERGSRRRAARVLHLVDDPAPARPPSRPDDPVTRCLAPRGWPAGDREAFRTSGRHLVQTRQRVRWRPRPVPGIPRDPASGRRTQRARGPATYLQTSPGLAGRIVLAGLTVAVVDMTWAVLWVGLTQARDQSACSRPSPRACSVRRRSRAGGGRRCSVSRSTRRGLWLDLLFLVALLRWPRLRAWVSTRRGAVVCRAGLRRSGLAGDGLARPASEPGADHAAHRALVLAAAAHPPLSRRSSHRRDSRRACSARSVDPARPQGRGVHRGQSPRRVQRTGPDVTRGA